MKILFDQGTPAPLRHYLEQHRIRTAFEMGWSNIENGDLLSNAEIEGFEILLTTDSNLQYQQNRTIAIVVLSTTSWPRIKEASHLITNAVSKLTAGDYVEIDIP